MTCTRKFVYHKGTMISICVLSCFLLNILLCYASEDAEQYLKREHSLVMPYQGNPYWDFIGSTMITNEHVRLTPNIPSNQGSIWNSVPCVSQNWELHVHFKVTGSEKHLFGDGFAIWYVKNRMKLGPIFGSMDYFSGLAVIVDTYSNHNGAHNHKHPYMSAMINNGSLHYDHDRDGTHTMIGGCSVEIRNAKFDTFIAIRYEDDILTVSHDLEGKGQWEVCFSVEGVQLPTGYFLGASAATGDLSDTHDILSIRMYELPTSGDVLARSGIIPSAAKFEPFREHSPDEKPAGISGFKLFLLLVVGLVACIVCVIGAYAIYQKRDDHSRKRFY